MDSNNSIGNNPKRSGSGFGASSRRVVGLDTFAGPLQRRKLLRRIQQAQLHDEPDTRLLDATGNHAEKKMIPTEGSLIPAGHGNGVPGGEERDGSGALPTSNGSNEAENTTTAAVRNTPAEGTTGGTSGSGSGGGLINASPPDDVHGSGGVGSGAVIDFVDELRHGGGARGARCVGAEGTGEGTGGNGSGSGSGGGGHSGSGSGNNSSEDASLSGNDSDLGSGDGSGCGSGSLGVDLIRSKGRKEDRKLPATDGSSLGKRLSSGAGLRKQSFKLAKVAAVDAAHRASAQPTARVAAQSSLDDEPILFRARKYRGGAKAPQPQPGGSSSPINDGREGADAKGRRRVVHANSIANLQRLKTCPKCGHVYGNKMGGRPGGSQCTTMVPVGREGGGVANSKHGQPLLVRCPYVFMSSARRKGGGGTETVAGGSGFVTASEEMDQRPRVRGFTRADAGEDGESSDMSTHETLLSHQELALKMDDTIRMFQGDESMSNPGSSLYLALCGMTRSTGVEASPSQAFAARESHRGIRSGLLLLRRFSGPFSSIMYGNEDSTLLPVEASLTEVLSSLQESSSDEDDSLDAAQSSGSGGHLSFSGSFDPDSISTMDSLLAAIGLLHHAPRMSKHGLDLPSLAALLRSNSPHGPKALAATTGISTGAACKIAQSVFMLRHQPSLSPDHN